MVRFSYVNYALLTLLRLICCYYLLGLVLLAWQLDQEDAASNQECQKLGDPNAENDTSISTNSLFIGDLRLSIGFHAFKAAWHCAQSCQSTHRIEAEHCCRYQCCKVDTAKQADQAWAGKLHILQIAANCQAKVSSGHREKSAAAEVVDDRKVAPFSYSFYVPTLLDLGFVFACLLNIRKI